MFNFFLINKMITPFIFNSKQQRSFNAFLRYKNIKKLTNKTRNQFNYSQHTDTNFLLIFDMLYHWIETNEGEKYWFETSIEYLMFMFEQNKKYHFIKNEAFFNASNSLLGRYKYVAKFSDEIKCWNDFLLLSKKIKNLFK